MQSISTQVASPAGSGLPVQFPVSRIGSLRDGWIEFLSRYEWDWFVTLTFRDSKHPEAADKLFRKFINDINRQIYGKRWRERGEGVYWVRALEWQKRDVIHFHVLMSCTQDLNEVVRRLSMMDAWNKIAGFAKIEKPNSQECVNRYCSKYIIKGGELDCAPTLRAYKRQV